MTTLIHVLTIFVLVAFMGTRNAASLTRGRRVELVGLSAVAGIVPLGIATIVGMDKTAGVTVGIILSAAMLVITLIAMLSVETLHRAEFFQWNAFGYGGSLAFALEPVVVKSPDAKIFTKIFAVIGLWVVAAIVIGLLKLAKNAALRDPAAGKTIINAAIAVVLIAALVLGIVFCCKSCSKDEADEALSDPKTQTEIGERLSDIAALSRESLMKMFPGWDGSYWDNQRLSTNSARAATGISDAVNAGGLSPTQAKELILHSPAYADGWAQLLLHNKFKLSEEIRQNIPQIEEFVNKNDEAFKTGAGWTIYVKRGNSAFRLTDEYFEYAARIAAIFDLFVPKGEQSAKSLANWRLPPFGDDALARLEEAKYQESRKARILDYVTKDGKTVARVGINSADARPEILEISKPKKAPKTTAAQAYEPVTEYYYEEPATTTQTTAKKKVVKTTKKAAKTTKKVVTTKKATTTKPTTTKPTTTKPTTTKPATTKNPNQAPNKNGHADQGGFVNKNKGPGTYKDVDPDAAAAAAKKAADAAAAAAKKAAQGAADVAGKVYDYADNNKDQLTKSWGGSSGNGATSDSHDTKDKNAGTGNGSFSMN